MNKNFQNILKLILVIILILFLIFIFYFFSKSNKNNSLLLDLNNSADQNLENKNHYLDSIPVVEKDSDIKDEKIAKPENVSPASQVSNSSIRTFELIVAENNKFNPEFITAYKGDVVDFYIKAVDKDYDFYQPDYGYKQIIKKGEQKRIQFQVATEGKFIFYCESCGGPDKGPIGYIIVKSK